MTIAARHYGALVTTRVVPCKNGTATAVYRDGCLVGRIDCNNRVTDATGRERDGDFEWFIVSAVISTTDNTGR